jgi:hypothetical protein
LPLLFIIQKIIQTKIKFKFLIPGINCKVSSFNLRYIWFRPNHWLSQKPYENFFKYWFVTQYREWGVLKKFAFYTDEPVCTTRSLLYSLKRSYKGRIAQKFRACEASLEIERWTTTFSLFADIKPVRFWQLTNLFRDCAKSMHFLNH